MHPCSFNDLFTIFIAKSRTNANCSVYDGCTVLKTLSKVWKMKLRFLGMDCYLHFFFWNILALTLLYLFTTRIYFERASNTEIPYWILQPIYLYNIFQTGTRYFLLKLVFFFKFWPTLWQSSSTFRATILCYFCIVASRLACKPHLEEIQ